MTHDYRTVRDLIAAETAKLPTVDHNGRPLPAGVVIHNSSPDPADVPAGVTNVPPAPTGTADQGPQGPAVPTPPRAERATHDQKVQAMLLAASTGVTQATALATVLGDHR